MRLRLIAVGERPPSWARDAYTDFARRLPRGWSLTLTEIAPARRVKNGRAQTYRDDEANRLLNALSPRRHTSHARSRRITVALDERGEAWSSEQLAAQLEHWQRAAEGDVTLIIGGPDGLADEVLQACDTRWSLSPLTFPHALVRVLIAEQIYRAWSILNRHPYHRA